MEKRLKPENERADVVGEREVGSAGLNPRQRTCGRRTQMELGQGGTMREELSHGNQHSV
jgi:hypothetical protein